ncbi:MAG: universal stress protein [Nitrospiraceae bacterium]|nr:universal stress protein [Nitrospira sp.]MCB9772825.1 universal stress protein [Nitrospiraceae bacterium]
MKVLLAVEQTRISEGAIQVLSRLTLPGGSVLFLLHVNPVPQKITGLAKERILKISQQVQEVQKQALEQAREFLGRVEKRVSHQGVQVFPLVKKGFPGEEILKTIHAKDVDLVVLGSRGYSKAKGILLGSVSQWVLQEAPCSVLIARPMAREKKAGRGMKLLLATDGSADSRAAVEFIQNLTLPPSSQITILHVVKKHVFETEQTLIADSRKGDEFAKLAEELLAIRGREGAKLLEQTRKVLSAPDLHIQERLVFGNPGDEILKAVRYLRADLVVLGSRGSTGVKRVFLGSVSNKVVSGAGCSVAVIRH